MVTWNRETDLLGKLVKNHLNMTSYYLFNYGLTDVEGREMFLRVNDWSCMIYFPCDICLLSIFLRSNTQWQRVLIVILYIVIICSFFWTCMIN